MSSVTVKALHREFYNGTEASGEGKARRLTNRESLDLPPGRSIFRPRPSSRPEGRSREFRAPCFARRAC